MPMTIKREEAGVEIVAVDCELVDIATLAWLTYGKGRHPASLDFTDCLSYALAQRAMLPLLYKGDDFSQTDIQAAISTDEH